MAGDTGIAGKVALLLWAQTLGLAGIQTTQILVEPPWRPPVLWDQVTLTCQGLGTAGATTWYKDGRRWWQERHDRLNVTESGTYECDRPGTGLSPPVTVLDGTYQCMATNQADEHRVFRALSPELVLEVTPRDTGTHRDAVAAGYGGALLFLLLLVGVIVAWHRWHRVAARKNQERAPPDPPAPPEEGEVLYTHVVVTRRAAGEYGGDTRRGTCHPRMSLHPDPTARVSQSVPPCHHTPGPPRDLRGTAGTPGATAGTR
ncbi:uncharacterized protein LOC132334505 [Haemorhous mexicanus]|uniref:uncharacterized protein LOC132334505 n=1 Tax=Haemorhous mexicanus TaxID=30427 RepID=UPI0028BD6C1C|nr:uncharacterized protein LOC132334505 [Haemorhous mexicanus]